MRSAWLFAQGARDAASGEWRLVRVLERLVSAVSPTSSSTTQVGGVCMAIPFQELY